jgi:hypothetical protein
MEATTRIAIVAMALVMPGFALADPAIRLANAISVMPRTEHTLRQECWVEHVQVQPARAISRTVRGNPVGADATSGATGEHLGAEHWNADVQRACRLQWMTGIAGGAYDSRRYALDN